MPAHLNSPDIDSPTLDWLISLLFQEKTGTAPTSENIKPDFDPSEYGGFTRLPRTYSPQLPSNTLFPNAKLGSRYQLYSDLFRRGFSVDEVMQLAAIYNDGPGDAAQNEYSQLVQRMLDLDARKYNEEQRDYTNDYNSPVSQLRRLMQTGMSRDAALAMLGSGAAGSGGASQLSAASTPLQMYQSAADANLKNEQAKTSEQERKLGIANTVLGGLSALVGSASGIAQIVNLGMSVPSVIANNTLQQLAASDMQKAAIGMQAAGDLMSAINSAAQVSETGISLSERPDEQTYQSYESMKKWLEQQPQLLADGKPCNAAVAQYVQTPEYQQAKSNPYFYNYIRQQYMDTTAARGLKDLETEALRITQMRNNEKKMSDLQVDFQQLANDLKQNELDVSDATKDDLIQISHNNRDISLEELNQAQENTNYEKQLHEKDLFGRDIQNKVSQSEYEDYLMVRDKVNAYKLNEWQDKLEFLLASRTPEQLKRRLVTLKNDTEFSAYASYMKVLRQKNIYFQYMHSSSMQYIDTWAYLLNQCGWNSLTNTASTAAQTVSSIHDIVKKPAPVTKQIIKIPAKLMK